MTAPRISDNELPLGMNVETADGKKLGKIKDIQSDHYVVEKGLFFIDDFFVPKQAIISIEGDVARVGLNEADLDGSGWEEPPIYNELDELAFNAPSANPVNSNDPFGVIAVPPADSMSERPPGVTDAPAADEAELIDPAHPVTDQDVPKASAAYVEPGGAWDKHPEGLDDPLSEDQSRTPKSDKGASELAGSGRAAMSDDPVARGNPRIQFDVGLPVHSADDQHVGDVVTVSPHHVMVEKGKLFKHDFSIPKTAFHERRGERLYLNVPAIALETAGWETQPEPGIETDNVIPIPPFRPGI